MESYSSAVNDFRRARNRAAMQEILGRLTGKSTELLSYEEVRQKLRASGVVSKSLREIPMDAIVGSVGRYHDFTRDFLPKIDSDQDRWARVKLAVADFSGLPPVEVYQIGDVYFVHDGHHRVSVARQNGAESVQAYVTEIRSKVPLSADIEPEELIRKAEQVDFLNQTHLDELRPGSDLSVTCAGQYQKLLEHIEVHRHFMGIEQQREIPYEEAVIHWYDTVYKPIKQIIEELGILDEFPGRTEADIYLWIGKHRSDIEDILGWEIPYYIAAADLVDQEGTRWSRVISRIGQQALDVIVPEQNEIPDEFEQIEPLTVLSNDHLFSDILVAVSGEEESWIALEQAIEITRREEGNLRGLFVVADEEMKEGPQANSIRDRFYWRCGEVGVPGQFAVDVGPVARTICNRARWLDLVIVSLAHPPKDSPRSRWASGFRTLIKHCTKPVLAVPGEVSPLTHAMLAFDGSSNAEVALYLATYLSGRWQLPLLVVAISEDGVNEETIEFARQYLDAHNIKADYIFADGPVAETILNLAMENGCDLIIMGGYSGNPLLEIVLGTTVDTILGRSMVPLLICK